MSVWFLFGSLNPAHTLHERHELADRHAVNLVYGWQKGSDLPGSVIWAAVSLAVAIVFALSSPGVVGSVERRN